MTSLEYTNSLKIKDIVFYEAWYTTDSSQDLRKRYYEWKFVGKTESYKAKKIEHIENSIKNYIKTNKNSIIRVIDVSESETKNNIALINPLQEQVAKDLENSILEYQVLDLKRTQGRIDIDHTLI